METLSMHDFVHSATIASQSDCRRVMNNLYGNEASFVNLISSGNMSYMTACAENIINTHCNTVP